MLRFGNFSAWQLGSVRLERLRVEMSKGFGYIQEGPITCHHFFVLSGLARPCGCDLTASLRMCQVTLMINNEQDLTQQETQEDPT